MKIVIVGSGYVGLVSGVCFAEMGNHVICVDNDKDRVRGLKNGSIPIFEPGLEGMLLKNIENQNLFFTEDLADAIKDAEIVFIAVGTPIGGDGAADLQFVLDVAKSIGMMMQKRMVIVDKSTVPIGTADRVMETIQEQLNKRNVSIEFDVVSNPEFLKEGDAINDFMKPDRIIIGSENQISINLLKQLYSPFFRTHDRFITMDVRSAEMTKYAANAMLATKISFMNEIANICEKVGADANQVRIGIGSDQRIGYSFIYPGIGYGGSCLPKDVKALKRIAIENGCQSNLISSVDYVNDNQKSIFFQKIINRFGEDLTGMTFAIWGLSFKPGTDDMREAPSLYIVEELIKRGAHVNVYDPKAMKEAEKFYLKGMDRVTYFNDKYDVLYNSEALILLTEWKEFRSPDFEIIKSALKFPVILDGRNQYMAYNLEEKNIEYIRVGK